MTNVFYTPAEGVVEVFDNFAWPGGTAITPVACTICTEVCCATPVDPEGQPTCCSSLNMQEDDGVTIECAPSPCLSKSVEQCARMRLLRSSFRFES